MKQTVRKLWTAAAALTLSMAGAGVAGAPAFASTTARHAPTSNVTLQETGSTLLFPLFQRWVPVYAKVAPHVKLTPSGTGSGTGISEATSRVVQIGASDAFMSDSMVKQTPGVLNIPLAISAQQIMYNIPGMKASQHLHLTGNVIAQIYLGKIKYWNAPQIASLNKGVKLPHLAITPVHRTDGSGDTFLFTQFMTDTNSQWAHSVQYGTSVSWPAVSYSLGANGNQGVVQLASKTKGSIAYVGISWLDNALGVGMGEAALQNRAGRFLLPTTQTISAAAGELIKHTPKDERISLIYAPGPNSYPIINYEYAIVMNHQANARVAGAVRSLLLWAINPHGGNAPHFMTAVHFLPLPASIYPLSRAQIEQIK